MGSRSKGIAWATLAAIATIIGVGYTIWRSEQKEDREHAERAAKAVPTDANVTTTCTITGKIFDRYSGQPLGHLNVVVFKPNTCDVVATTSTELDGRYVWRGPCAEIDGMPIQVTLGEAGCLMPTGGSVTKGVESSLNWPIDSAMLNVPGRCLPCPTR